MYNKKFSFPLICILFLHYSACISSEYAAMLEIPQDLKKVIHQLQSTVITAIDTLNEKAETPLEKPECLPIENMHFTVQALADGTTITLTQEQEAHIVTILSAIAQHTPAFNVADQKSAVKIVQMGNFIALEFEPIPAAFASIHKEIVDALHDAQITFGPQYPTLRLHVSFLKSKNNATKDAMFTMLKDASLESMPTAIIIEHMILNKRNATTKTLEKTYGFIFQQK